MQTKPEHWYCGFRVRETSLKKLKKTFVKVLLEAQITVLGSRVYYYKGGGNGFTLIIFLGESHLAITVYPEFDEPTMIEFSCCNKKLFDNLVEIVQSRNMGYGFVFTKV